MSSVHSEDMGRVCQIELAPDAAASFPDVSQSKTPLGANIVETELDSSNSVKSGTVQPCAVRATTSPTTLPISNERAKPSLYRDVSVSRATLPHYVSLPAYEDMFEVGPTSSRLRESKRITRAISEDGVCSRYSPIEDIDELDKECTSSLLSRNYERFKYYYIKLQVICSRVGIRLNKFKKNNLCFYDVDTDIYQYYTFKQHLYYLQYKFVTGFRVPFQRAMVNNKVPSQDTIVNLFKRKMEDIGIYIMQVMTSSTLTQFVLATITFIKNITGRTIASIFGDTVNAVHTFVKHYLFTPSPENNGVEQFLEACKGIRTNWNEISENHIFQRFYKLIAYFSTTSIAISLGLNEKIELFLPGKLRKVENFNSLDMLQTLGGTLLDFFSGAYQYYVKGNTLGFVHTSETYVSWLQTCLKLKGYAPLVRDVPPDDLMPGEMTADNFFSQIEEAIAQGNEILRCSRAVGKGHDISTISRYLGDINAIYVRLLVTYRYGSTRDMPFSVLLYGNPGCGKSLLTKTLIRYYHQRFHPDVPFKENMIYTRANTDHWDQFKNTQKYGIFDDLACESSDTGQLPPKLQDIISVINTVPFLTPQAAIEDKGNVYAHQEFVVGTTNVKNLHALDYFSSAGALLRRFPYVVTVRAKPAYVTNGTLDILKAGGINDVYELVVERVSVTNTPPAKIGTPGFITGEFNVKYDTVLTTNSISIFLDFMGEQMDVHKEQQLVYRSLNTDPVGFNVCSTCMKINCSCNDEIQPAPESQIVIKLPSSQHITILGAGIGFAYFSVKTMTALADFWGRANSVVEDIAKLKRVGHRVEEYFFHTKHFVLKHFKVISAVLGSVVIYAALGSFGSRLIKAEADNVRSLHTKKTEEKSTYIHTPSPSLYSDVKCISTVTKDQLMGLVEKNTVTFKAVPPFGYSTTGPSAEHCFEGFGLCGNTFIVPRHGLPVDGSEFVISYEGGKFTSPTFIWDDKYVSHIESVDDTYDLSVVCVVGAPLRKDLRKFINNKALPVGAHLEVFVRDKHLPGKIVFGSTFSIGGDKTVFEVPAVTYSARFPGKCGSPVIGKFENGFGIIGFHVAGALYGQGWAHTPTIDQIMATIEAIEGTIKLGRFTDGFSEADVMSHRYTPSIRPTLHPKNMMNFLDCTAVEILGEIEGIPHGPPKCDVRPAYLHDQVNHHFGDSGYRIPNFKVGWLNGTYYHPFQENVKHIATTPLRVKLSNLDDAICSFLEKIKKGVESSKLYDDYVYTPLTNYETINGIPGCKFIDGMKLNTGGGFGMFTKKSKFIYDCPQEGYPDGKMFDDEVLAQMSDIEEKLLRGQTVSPIYCAHLKSEPRVEVPLTDDEIRVLPEELRSNGAVNSHTHKVKAPRVFSGAPAAHSAVVRKYFLPLVKVIQDDPFTFETAVGVNAQSGDWSEFYKYLTIHGDDRIVAGDFKKFDKYANSVIMLAAFHVLIELAKLLRCRNTLPHETIGIDTSSPLLYIFYTLLRLFSSNPSGFCMTVILNSLINSLYVRLAWIEAGFPIQEFNININLLTYGDDNIMGVSTRYNFNFGVVKRSMGKIGLVYTLPDKSDDDVEFSNICDVDFLKRMWRFSDELQTFVAPLSFPSIIRSLSWISESKITELEHCYEVVDTSQREAYFHGRAVYDAFISKLRLCLTDTFVTAELHSYDFWTDFYRPKFKRKCITFVGVGCFNQTVFEPYSDTDFCVESRKNMNLGIFLWAPLMEEAFKTLVPPWSFASFEFLLFMDSFNSGFIEGYTLYGFVVIRLAVVLMHCYVATFPLPVAVGLHALWNLVATCSELYRSGCL